MNRMVGQVCTVEVGIAAIKGNGVKCQRRAVSKSPNEEYIAAGDVHYMPLTGKMRMANSISLCTTTSI